MRLWIPFELSRTGRGPQSLLRERCLFEGDGDFSGTTLSSIFVGRFLSDNIQAKVELFEQIRREYEFGVGTIKGVAHKLGVHRRMVRQALMNAEPPERKQVERKRHVIEPLRAFIDAILEGDRNAPRKQRHTAHRIFERVRTELPEHKVAEVTVRLYVRERKRELGWSMRATCIPQSYAPAQEAQVDWYEAAYCRAAGQHPSSISFQ
jgi:hypothetical protein